MARPARYDDFCFRCRLPDCDETSPHCVIRRINRHYWNKMRRGERDQVTPDEHAAANLIFQFWHLERAAEASEGGRPYCRDRRAAR